jgi:hypothetical protein
MNEDVGVARWCMRGLLLFVLAFANLNDIWSPDVLPNALFAWTVIREGDLDYDEFVIRPGVLERPAGTTANMKLDGLDSEAYFFRACGVSTATEPPKAARSPGGPPAPGPNDHVCSIFPPGIAFLAFPFFMPFVLTGAEPLDLGLLVRVGHAAAATIEVLAALLLWSVMRRFASERWSLALVLLYFLATSVRTVASQALWQHAGVHLAIALALWLVLVARPISPRRELAAGIALGFGSVVRQTTAILVPFVPGGRLRATLLAVAGAAIGIVPLLAYNALAFGNPLEQGYGTKPFDTSPVIGLYGLLLSPSRGLFVYEPYILFAFGTVALLSARRELVERRLLALPYAWAATAILYATYAEWWGGRVFGPRFLDDLAPLLSALLAWGIGHGLLARRAARVVFWIFAAWSLLIFQAAAFVYDQNTWDLHPTNINVDPARLLDWSDPQWLFVLRSLPDGGVRVVVAAGLSALALLFLLRVESVLPSRR